MTRTTPSVMNPQLEARCPGTPGEHNDLLKSCRYCFRDMPRDILYEWRFYGRWFWCVLRSRVSNGGMVPATTTGEFDLYNFLDSLINYYLLVNCDSSTVGSRKHGRGYKCWTRLYNYDMIPCRFENAASYQSERSAKGAQFNDYWSPSEEKQERLYL